MMRVERSSTPDRGLSFFPQRKTLAAARLNLKYLASIVVVASSENEIWILSVGGSKLALHSFAFPSVGGLGLRFLR
jgi:hypothetical protein